MQRKSLLKSVIAAGILAFGGLAASAAPVTFTFNASSGLTTTDVLSGLGVTVSAWTFNGAGSDTKTLAVAPGSSVTFKANGLGEKLTASDTNETINGSGATLREALRFNFTAAVKLMSITVTRLAGSGSLGGGLVFVGGTGSVTPGAGDTTFTSATGVPSVVHTFTNPAYQGMDLAIGARAGGNFLITSITVDKLPPVTPVPVPAAGLMLGSLVVLPLLRRKQRRAA